MKKNTAIVLGGSFDMAFAIGEFLIDLKKHSPNLADDVIIFHDGISKKDQEIMKSILSVKFIEFKLNIDLSRLSYHIRNRYSDLVFFKYECLKLLKEYKTVIITDFDIVLLDDISELAIPGNENSTCKMMVSNDRSIFANNLVPSILKDYDLKNYDLNYCIGTGLMVLYDSLENIDELYDYCIKNTEKYIQYLVLPEQVIFAFMVQDFKIKPEKIDRSIYVVHPNDENKKQNAKILHAYGENKFWNRINNASWNDNYNEWVKMGGSRKDSKAFVASKFSFTQYIIEKITWLIPIYKLRYDIRHKLIRMFVKK